MPVGNFKILYFEDFRECFKTYEAIVFNLNYPNNSIDIKWSFPFQINDGYGIVYKPQLDKMLDMDNYEIRWVMNPFMNELK
jgi:hypothetical protein